MRVDAHMGAHDERVPRFAWTQGGREKQPVAST
jgi:hypothetical protein